VKEDKTGGACGTYEDNRNMFRVTFRVLAGKSEGKRTPGKS